MSSKLSSAENQSGSYSVPCLLRQTQMPVARNAAERKTFVSSSPRNLIYFSSSYKAPGGGGEVLPYISYIGMCRPKGYGFRAVLVWKRV